MTDLEKSWAIAPSHCTFVTGTGAKRFARNMGEAAKLEESPELTPKQREYLRTAVIRFRRQIMDSVVLSAMKDGGLPKYKSYELSPKSSYMSKVGSVPED